MIFPSQKENIMSRLLFAVGALKGVSSSCVTLNCPEDSFCEEWSGKVDPDCDDLTEKCEQWEGPLCAPNYGFMCKGDNCESMGSLYEDYYYESCRGLEKDCTGMFKDIDECDGGFHGCNINSHCVNTHGAFNCVAKKGYMCQDRNHQCDGPACLGTECEFVKVEEPKAKAIVKVNECEGNHGCPSPSSTCHDMDDGYICEPVYGYLCEGDNCQGVGPQFDMYYDHACVAGADGSIDCDFVDIDECAEGAYCPLNSKCKNMKGHYHCIPDAGWRCSEQRSRGDDGTWGKVGCNGDGSCEGSICFFIDIDECEKNPCPGNEVCENTEGSYTCKQSSANRLVALVQDLDNQKPEFNCGARMRFSGFENDDLDMNGLWRLVTDDEGSITMNDGYPYYKSKDADLFLWFNAGRTGGYWVANGSPGRHGNDRALASQSAFKCPQDSTFSTRDGATGFSIAEDQCCMSIEWANEETGVKETFTRSTSVNEGYPIYRVGETYMWWTMAGKEGRWIVNKTPGKHINDLLRTGKTTEPGCPVEGEFPVGHSMKCVTDERIKRRATVQAKAATNVEFAAEMTNNASPQFKAVAVPIENDFKAAMASRTRSEEDGKIEVKVTEITEEGGKAAADVQIQITVGDGDDLSVATEALASEVTTKVNAAIEDGTMALIPEDAVITAKTVHPCDTDNKGGCEQECIKHDGKTRWLECKCGDGFELNNDQRSCDVIVPETPEGGAVPDTPKSKDTKCPEDCWTLNTETNECEANKGKDSCYNLECKWGAMVLSFGNDLFAITKAELPNPFKEDSADVEWVEANDQWEADCPLGTCGMELSSREIDGIEHMVFGMRVVLDRKAQKIEDLDIYMKNPRRVSLLFECAYKQEVKITTTDFAVHSVDAAGEAIEYGDLTDGFEIDVFTDETFETPAEDTTVYIGQTLYAEVVWKVKEVSNIADFYVDDCKVLGKDDTSITLIEDNCYSEIFGVQQLQKEKLVTEKSRFRFTSFIVGEGSKQMQYKLSCVLKICSKAEEKCSKDWINTEDNQCPDSDVYRWKALTYQE